MKFIPTDLDGVYVIEPRLISDERGFFTRVFCSEELEKRGLEGGMVQGNLSHSLQAGTLRGMHYQSGKNAEAKVVRCTRGAVIDVVVDMREGSSTRLQHVAVELSSENRRALYIPRECANGFQTLMDHTEVNYLVSHKYAPESEVGIRYDDPDLCIDWPLEVTNLSPKDQKWIFLRDR